MLQKKASLRNIKTNSNNTNRVDFKLPDMVGLVAMADKAVSSRLFKQTSMLSQS